MRRLLSAAILLSPIFLAPACDQPSRICDLVCECEHCNDLAEDYGCEQISASQEIAEIYECLDEWKAYADCYEDKGTCDEEEANFTTQEEGSCSATASSGIACTDNTECLNVGFEGARCEDMLCVYTACAGSGDQPGQPCTSNSDCQSGTDKCAEEGATYAECLTDASDNPAIFSGFNFDFD
jgi:hypothetical protein